MNTILSKLLQLSDLPGQKPSWHDFSVFALTFDPKLEVIDYAGHIDLEIVSNMSSVSELRMCLFVEQRRYNHFGTPPSYEVMNKLYQVLEWIRDDLTNKRSTKIIG